MAGEIVSAFQSVRVLMDVLKANKTLTNFNELVSAVSEVNADLLSAQAMALSSQKSEMALAQRVRELEKEIGELKDWERKTKNYSLMLIGPGVFAYEMQFGVESGEIPHCLCTSCYEDRKKSILQCRSGSTTLHVYLCPRCNATFPHREGHCWNLT